MTSENVINPYVMEEIEAVLDPTGQHYKDGTTMKSIVDVCGLLLKWGADDTYDNFKDRMEKNYRYFHSWRTTTDIDEDGVYHYPEDPPLYPFVSMRHKGDIMYLFPHQMVAIVSPECTIISRFD